jgi:RNA polymerase-binding transcription factor DksA
MQTETSDNPLAGPVGSRAGPVGERPRPVAGRAGPAGGSAGPAGGTPRPAGGSAGPAGGTPRPAGGSAGPAGGTAGRAGGPRWRAMLEARWRARLQEVTELALAYHDAAATAVGRGTRSGHEARLRLRTLLRQTVASRRALADTEEALARLSAGNYGWCESCAGAISAQRLVITPETRYCARCAQEPRAEAPAHRAPAAHGDRLAARSPRREQAR